MSITRAEFEVLVERALGSILRSYGFTLAPQAPPDFPDTVASAYYEIPLAEFQERLPGAASQTDADVDHVDLTVTWQPPRLVLELEGTPLATTSGGGSLEDQLAASSEPLEHALAELA